MLILQAPGTPGTPDTPEKSAHAERNNVPEFYLRMSTCCCAAASYEILTVNVPACWDAVSNAKCIIWKIYEI